MTRVISSKTCVWFLYIFVLLDSAMLLPMANADTPYTLTYSGRFVDKTGAPLKGPLALNVEFFNALSGGSQKGGVFTYSAIPTNDGVFQLSIVLGTSDFNTIFDGNSSTWIQVTDTTNNNRVYPRQRMFAVPYALKVPVYC